MEANIQGEQFHLSCIEYMFSDPKIQALCCTRMQVKEMLVNVCFTPERRTKPDHSVTTLMYGCCMKLSLAHSMH